jgi:hypothetical protein
VGAAPNGKNPQIGLPSDMMSIVSSGSAQTPVLATGAQSESGSALTYFEERSLIHFVLHLDAQRGHQYVILRFASPGQDHFEPDDGKVRATPTI